MAIAITTPTGNIGSKVVSLLLEQGADLTLLLRNPNKLDPAVRSRVKIHQGEQQDAEFVRRATEGAEASFWVSPDDTSTDDVHGRYEELIRPPPSDLSTCGTRRKMFRNSAPSAVMSSSTVIKPAMSLFLMILLIVD